MKWLCVEIAGVVLTTVLMTIEGHPEFQRRIPNGNRVPNPCNQSIIWPGVGHQNSAGGGPRNPFGLDFKANGLVWNATICNKDSDGDGMTNGHELGDHECKWTVNATPSGVATSHPGICEPVGSAKCAGKNSWLGNCTSAKFDCPAINDPRVRNYTMRFPRTTIPSNKTTYMCYNFVFPNISTAADIIAIEPVIDNARIIHHMLLYGCADKPLGVPDGRPYPCGMDGKFLCPSLIGLWGPGVKGQCLNDQLGFRIGSQGLRYAIVQIHWNNHMQEANQTDSSGMKIHYTTQLRPNRGEIMTVGQNFLEIPPGEDEITFCGKCSASCTSRFSHPINITSSVLHMHLLGKSGGITLYRKDHTKFDLEIVDNYDYDTPELIEFETPVEVKPGDYLEVKCAYDSIGKNTTTKWGFATSDEMCYAFFAYYPQLDGFTFCGQWKNMDLCSNGTASDD